MCVWVSVWVGVWACVRVHVCACASASAWVCVPKIKCWKRESEFVMMRRDGYQIFWHLGSVWRTSKWVKLCCPSFVSVQFFFKRKKVGAVLESRKIIKTEPPLKCFRSGIKNRGRPNYFRRSCFHICIFQLPKGCSSIPCSLGNQLSQLLFQNLPCSMP